MHGFNGTRRLASKLQYPGLFHLLPPMPNPTPLPPPRPATVAPLAREFFLPPPTRPVPTQRSLLTTVGRCLGLAVLACLLTRPWFQPPASPAAESARVGAPVSVTADIARRLAMSASYHLEAGIGTDDAVLWAGME